MRNFIRAVLAVALLATRWLERPDAASLRRCLLFLPPILAAIWLNNRRIAWVGLTASAALIWNFARWNAGKRALARGALFAVPLAVAYVAAGWQSDAPAFKPEISCVAMIENAGLGSRFGAPSVRAIYDVYYAKTRGAKEPAGSNVAMRIR